VQARGKAVYVSGEETQHQIKLRAERLGVKGEKLYLLAETDLEVILSQIEQLQPSLVVIDSIQTVYLPDLAATPGSITQVRECTLRLMRWAKLSAVPVFIAGHVTKMELLPVPGYWSILLMRCSILRASLSVRTGYCVASRIALALPMRWASLR